LICVGNFSALPRKNYRLGLPKAGEYRLLVNTDAEVYGGSGASLAESIVGEKTRSGGREYSVSIDLPPFSTLWFEVVGS
jgi:1,4-alpha-glucan branching enzyme